MILIYLFKRFIYRLKEFLRHWYIKSFFIYTNFIVSFLERLDQVLALKITLRHIFQPLYGDYSILGHILGFIFRSSRIIVASFIYLCIILLAIGVYVIWLLLPIYIILKIFNFERFLTI